MSTITENNRLIADFMDWKHSSDPDFDNWEMSLLKYHSSWDWLMPAVEKIEKTKTFDNDEGYENVEQCWRVNIFSGDCVISYASNFYGWSEKFYGNDSTILGTVYDAVIQFIQWYNEQIKNS